MAVSWNGGRASAGGQLPALIEPASRARRRTHPVLAIVVVLVAMLVPLLVLRNPLGDLLGPLDWDGAFTADSAPRHLLFLVIVLGVSVGLLWLWLALYEERPFWTLGFTGGRVGVKLARGFLLGAALNLIPYFVPIWVGWVSVESRHVSAGWPSLLAGVVIIAVAFILQGSTEEVLFRGFLTQAVGLRWGLTAAIIIQVPMFAAAHAVANPPPIAYLGLALVAVLLAGYAALEGGLWGVCAFHGAWNWSNSVAAIWPSESAAVEIIRNFAVPAITAIVIFYLLAKRGVPTKAVRSAASEAAHH